MQIAGIVISKQMNKTMTSKAGGSYSGWEVQYKDLSNDEIKTLSKPTQSLKQVAGLESALADLTPGDKFVYEIEKVGNFWELKALTKGEMAVPLPTSQPKKSWAGGGGSAQRDYETKDERAAKQKLIVAQSCISSAVETLKTGKAALDATEVKALAQDYFDWVFEKGK